MSTPPSTLNPFLTHFLLQFSSIPPPLPLAALCIRQSLCQSLHSAYSPSIFYYLLITSHLLQIHFKYSTTPVHLHQTAMASNSTQFLYSKLFHFDCLSVPPILLYSSPPFPAAFLPQSTLTNPIS